MNVGKLLKGALATKAVNELRKPQNQAKVKDFARKLSEKRSGAKTPR